MQVDGETLTLSDANGNESLIYTAATAASPSRVRSLPVVTARTPAEVGYEHDRTSGRSRTLHHLAGGDALEAAAARERQSHVRHELRAPLAVMYPLLSLLLRRRRGRAEPPAARVPRGARAQRGADGGAHHRRRRQRLGGLLAGACRAGRGRARRRRRGGRHSLRRMDDREGAVDRGGRRAAAYSRGPGRTVTTCARSSPIWCATP